MTYMDTLAEAIVHKEKATAIAMVIVSMDWCVNSTDGGETITVEQDPTL